MDLPSQMIGVLAGVALVFGLIYVLYMNGFGYFRMMTSLMNYQTAGIFSDDIRGKLYKCSGTAKKVFKVKKSGFYTFDFNNELDSGNIAVDLIDSRGNKVFSLGKVYTQSTDYLNESERYRLLFTYNKACGKFKLQWKNKIGE